MIQDMTLHPVPYLTTSKKIPKCVIFAQTLWNRRLLMIKKIKKMFLGM